MCYMTVTKSLITYLFVCHAHCLLFFFFNDTATTEIYTLSLHDAFRSPASAAVARDVAGCGTMPGLYRPCGTSARDRKSTRLNSSHANISYAVFCLKKKKKHKTKNNRKQVTASIRENISHL